MSVLVALYYYVGCLWPRNETHKTELQPEDATEKNRENHFHVFSRFTSLTADAAYIRMVTIAF
jgi:hypothetical protein